jgi:FdhD protein
VADSARPRAAPPVGVENAVGVRSVSVRRHGGDVEGDLVAVEAPLEIRVDGAPVVVTMRTPGEDLELAAGFLYTEGIVEDRDDLVELRELAPGSALAVLGEHGCAGGAAIVEARLRPRAGGAGADETAPRVRPRAFRATAACGVCGKQKLEDLAVELPSLEPLPVDDALLESLPSRLRERQDLFDVCGGLHGAGLFDASGALLCLREDVGRHNAVDKVIGWSLLRGELPLAGRILAVSGRAGFEIVQKAIRAAIPVVVAVGAASSSAVDLARGSGLALHTFVAAGRGNLHV